MNVGDVVGNYRITQVLGEGGMGVVYLATHELIGKEAAIKVLLPSLSNKQEVVQRFFNEAKTTTSIKHPGIVEVFDFGYSDLGHAYIVMERLEGETLDDRIKRLGKLPPDRAIALIGQIARALGAAHKLGVVHRDLKPANIYIVRDPEVAGGERTKILDFGIAKLRNSATGVRTASGQLMGAPDYMAPEQCLGASEVDQRADLYALGCILYHAVTGRPPFPGPNFSDVLAAHVSKQAPRASTLAPVPPPVDDLIARLMKKAPEERPQTTDELVALLPTAAAIAGGRAAGKTAPPPIPPAMRRTMAAPSQPPPVPGKPASIEIERDISTSAPLPPLPKPRKPGGTAPPPIPKAAASAKTMYENPAAAPKPGPQPVAPPPAGSPGPFNDPRLAKTMVPPSLGGAMSPGAPTPPAPDPFLAGQPMAHAPAPAAAPAPGPGPMSFGAPLQPPAQQAALPPRPQPAMHQPQPAMPQPQPAAMRPQPAPARPNPTDVVRPVGQRPQVHAGPAAFAPRQGNMVRPMPPPRQKSSPVLMIVLLVLAVGASAGGFFLYKSWARKKASANGGEAVADNTNTATIDAGAGKATPPAPDAASKVVAAPKPDASVAAATPDAAPVATVTPDAAPIAIDLPKVPDAGAPPPAAPDAAPLKAVGKLGSGTVIDPNLASATNDDGVVKVALKISSKPAGALVIRKHDNLPLGKTPIEYITRKFNANEEFIVRQDGYFDVTVKMSTNRDGKRLVPLLKRPKK